jgi:hypothetical protein
MMRGKDDKAQEVELTRIKRAEIVQKVNGTGKIQPNTEVNISPTSAPRSSASP